MKNLVNVLVPVIVIGLSGFFLNTLNAQPSNTSEDVTVGANIAAPLILTKERDLHFGTFAAGNGGTVTIAATSDGNRTFNGPIEIPSLGTSDDDPESAEFELKAHPQSTVTVTVPSTVTLTGPGDDMSVSLNSSVGGSIDFSGFGGNSTTFYIGGELTVGDGQTEGSYSGDFEVTVAYQ